MSHPDVTVRGMFRQGDVLLRPIDPSELPDGLVPAPPGRTRGLVLATGEATGHAHVVTGPDVTTWTLPDQAEVLFLIVRGHGRLSHEEHGPIGVPAGHYQVIRQREYVPGAWRPVAD